MKKYHLILLGLTLVVGLLVNKSKTNSTVDLEHLQSKAMAFQESGQTNNCALNYDDPQWFVGDSWGIYCITCDLVKGHNWSVYSTCNT